MLEFLWSEEMADASVHLLLNVDFKDTYNPTSGEIRNCHINVGTGKEVSIRQTAELIMQEIGFQGELRWDSSKPDGTMRKLTDVSKLHSLGWHHQVEIEEGVCGEECSKMLSDFFAALRIQVARDKANRKKEEE